MFFFAFFWAFFHHALGFFLFDRAMAAGGITPLGRVGVAVR